MKTTTLENSITLQGVNTVGKFVLMLLVIIPGLIIPVIWTLGDSWWIKAFLMASMLGFLVMFLRDYRRTQSEFVTINRSEYTVTVESDTGMEIHKIGKFQKILIQSVIDPDPDGGLQYHAYLVGTTGEASLNVISETGGVLLHKLTPVIEFLNLPVEDPDSWRSPYEIFAAKNANK